MSTIKLFAEFYGGRRRPNIDLYLNRQLLPYMVEYEDRSSFDCEHIILSAQVTLKDNNTFCVTMEDKTDDDLLINGDEIIDHYVVIREVEIDGIRAETVLHRCCKFEHSMPDEWVHHMKSRGYDIQPVDKNSTHIRLNGTWTMEFESPVWKWHTKKMAWEYRHESIY